MPLPTLNDVHVDAPLTTVSTAYLQAATGFIADKVFPVIPVNYKSDQVLAYNRRDFQRMEAQVLADDAEAAGGGYRMDAAVTYNAEVWAIRRDLGAQLMANATPPQNPERDATEWITQQLLLRRERQFLNAFVAAGVWRANDQTGVAGVPGADQFLQWNDPASTPIEDIAAQQDVIEGATGFRPMTLGMGAQIWRALRNHPDIVDRIGEAQVGPRIVAEQQMATILDVDKVLVARSVQDTSVQGAAADLTAYAMGRSAVLVYSAPRPAIMMPSGGYIFAWTGLLGAGAFGNRIRRIEMPWVGTGSTRIQGEMAFGLNVIDANLGRFFATAVAA